MRDNTAANNCGRFVGWFSGFRLYETDPPAATNSPSRFELAKAHLRSLGRATGVYANDNDNWWPNDAMRYYDCDLLIEPRSYWHAGDTDPIPPKITNSSLNDPESVQVSFEYLVAGLNENFRLPGVVIWRDNSVANNHNLGRLQFEVLDESGRWDVVWRPDCYGDVNGDGVVDSADLNILTQHIGQHDGLNPWDGDVDGDGIITMTDRQAIIDNMGKHCD